MHGLVGRDLQLSELNDVSRGKDRGHQLESFSAVSRRWGPTPRGVAIDQIDQMPRDQFLSRSDHEHNDPHDTILIIISRFGGRIDYCAK